MKKENNNKRKIEHKNKQDKKFIKEDDEDDFGESTSDLGDKPEFLGTELAEEPWERPDALLKPESMDLGYFLKKKNFFEKNN